MVEDGDGDQVEDGDGDRVEGLKIPREHYLIMAKALIKS